jgi:HD domain-containing protein
MGALEEQALAWIEPYQQAEHLRRTRDWLLELDAAASEALRLAALTHDIERYFPGGPVQDKTSAAWDDPGYNEAHAERSAAIVSDWLSEQGAPAELVADTARLIRLHEVGGTPEADLLQAADSVSFLETLQDVAAGWVTSGTCTPAKAREKLDWMLERIRVPPARELARPFHTRAIEAVERAATAPSGAR